MGVQFNRRDIEGLRRAITRNPQTVKKETQRFLTRGMAVYNRGVIRTPWRIGASGGGAPVDTGNLRDTHRREIRPFEARIYPTAKYAPYVHGVTGYPRRRSYQLRPWLDYVRQSSDREIMSLERELLRTIVSDLAK